jgi:hypothetical protein
MAYSEKGFKALGNMGSPDGVAGSVRNLHTYVTNETAAQVETSDFFLSIYKRLMVGDVLIVSIDADGTPSVRIYVFTTVTSASVIIARETAMVVGDQTAIVALTDNSGGTAANTIAVIGASYSQTEVANAIASLAAKVTAQRAALISAGLLTP